MANSDYRASPPPMPEDQRHTETQLASISPSHSPSHNFLGFSIQHRPEEGSDSEEASMLSIPTAFSIETDDSVVPSWRAELDVTMVYAPLAFVTMGKFMHNGQYLFLQGSGTNVLCFDVLTSRSPLCVFEFGFEQNLRDIYTRATTYYMDPQENWCVVDLAVDEKQDGKVDLAIQLVNNEGSEFLKIFRVCPVTWNAEVLAGICIEFDCITQCATEKTTTQLVGKNVLVFDDSGTDTLLWNWEEKKFAKLKSNSLILQLHLTLDYLVYVEYAEGEFSSMVLVIANLVQLWANTQGTSVLVDGLPSSKIPLNAMSPANICLDVQALDEQGKGQNSYENIRVTMAEMSGSSQAGMFEYNFWAYAVRSMKDLPQANNGNKFEMEIVLERFSHDVLPVFADCGRIDWYPLSQSRYMLVRCFDSGGSSSFFELCLPMVDAADFPVEEGSGESLDSHSYFLPIAIPFEDEDGLGEAADAVRRITVDARSSTYLWSGYVGELCVAIYD